MPNVARNDSTTVDDSQPPVTSIASTTPSRKSPKTTVTSSRTQRDPGDHPEDQHASRSSVERRWGETVIPCGIAIRRVFGACVHDEFRNHPDGGGRRTHPSGRSVTNPGPDIPGRRQPPHDSPPLGARLGDRRSRRDDRRLDPRGVPTAVVRPGAGDDQRARDLGRDGPVDHDGRTGGHRGRPPGDGGWAAPGAATSARRCTRSAGPPRSPSRCSRRTPPRTRTAWPPGSGSAALALWPALAARRGATGILSPAVTVGASAALTGLLGWFVVELQGDGDLIGLSERAVAGAQAVWPLVVVVALRRARPAAA